MNIFMVVALCLFGLNIVLYFMAYNLNPILYFMQGVFMLAGIAWDDEL